MATLYMYMYMAILRDFMPRVSYLWCDLRVQGTYAGQFVMEGFLNIHWARWKRVLLTRSVAMVPCIIIAIVAVNSLDYLDEYINVEQSLLVSPTCILV